MLTTQAMFLDWDALPGWCEGLLAASKTEEPEEENTEAKLETGVLEKQAGLL